MLQVCVCEMQSPLTTPNGCQCDMRIRMPNAQMHTCAEIIHRLPRRRQVHPNRSQHAQTPNAQTPDNKCPVWQNATRVTNAQMHKTANRLQIPKRQKNSQLRSMSKGNVHAWWCGNVACLVKLWAIDHSSTTVDGLLSAQQLSSVVVPKLNPQASVTNKVHKKQTTQMDKQQQTTQIDNTKSTTQIDNTNRQHKQTTQIETQIDNTNQTTQMDNTNGQHKVRSAICKRAFGVVCLGSQLAFGISSLAVADLARANSWHLRVWKVVHLALRRLAWHAVFDMWVSIWHIRFAAFRFWHCEFGTRRHWHLCVWQLCICAFVHLSIWHLSI